MKLTFRFFLFSQEKNDRPLEAHGVLTLNTMACSTFSKVGST
jgi:hypothetical protein